MHYGKTIQQTITMLNGLTAGIKYFLFVIVVHTWHIAAIIFRKLLY